MVKNKVVFFALSAIAASLAQAQAPTPTEAALRKIIEPRLGDGAKIDSVKETPYAGLYEIRAAGDILYTDKKGDYLFIGQVFDAKTSQNLTKDRVDEINKIKFSDLPLQSALKLVKGDGKRVIAIFEDPNCGYCKRFRQTTLQEIDNVTVYTFMYNILSEDSATKSKNIWCSPDRNKAWDDWMISGKIAATAPEKCDNPNNKISALGQKLRINGTPAIFFVDGSRLPGAVDTKTLESKFSTLKKAVN
ncbi:MAG: DsbC family protein [Pseudomonadota bacterium]